MEKMNLYRQVIVLLNRKYSMSELTIMIKELTNIRCTEARRVVSGNSDGRLVGLLQDLIDAMKEAEKSYNQRNTLHLSEDAKRVSECENRLKKYCLKMQ